MDSDGGDSNAHCRHRAANRFFFRRRRFQITNARIAGRTSHACFFTPEQAVATAFDPVMFTPILQALLIAALSLISIPLLLLHLLYRLVSRPCRARAPPPRSILITGASSGIGADLALHYAKALGGAGVALALSGRNLAALEAVAAACRAHGATVSATAVDVTDRARMAEWVAASEAGAPLDLVIANAGVTERTAGAPPSDLDAGSRACMEANFTGVLNTVLPALPAMRARGRGQVCVISSIAGFTQFAAFESYSASKAAARMWAEGLRWRLHAEGVRVSCVVPGYVSTPMTEAFGGSLNLMGIVSSAHAVRRIAAGLAEDEGLIAFPSATFIVSHALGALPPKVKDLLAWSGLAAEVRYDAARGGGGAGRAAAEQPLAPAAGKR